MLGYLAYKLCIVLCAVQMIPVHATVYGLNEGECDSSPTIGAFGEMGRFPRELAMTRSLQTELGIEPGDRMLVLTEDGRFSGWWWLADRQPGKTFKIDLQVEGSNWSGDAEIITWRKQ